MTWLPLESKMFTSVSYDADKQILYLRFRNTGDVYRYFEFPVAEYEHGGEVVEDQRDALVGPGMEFANAIEGEHGTPDCSGTG